MNQSERRNYLIKELLKEQPKYRDIQIPTDRQEQKNLLRSLFNVRMPKPISEDFVEIQNAYLQEEAAGEGITDIADLTPIRDSLYLWQGDITRLKVGAIVNAANSQMLGCFVPCHRCIDNAIHSAAGLQLREECSHIMKRRRVQYGGDYEEPTGTATLTKGYNLPCDYVIHTVGPICYGGLQEAHCRDLRNCYENVLKCCVENNIKSVAFCCISTGEFHFPNEKAAEIAVETVTAFLETHSDCMERIIFNVFQDKDREIYEKILGLT